VAGIYLLAHAEFIAAIQVIVYAGAIMVLFLFVIMLLNLRQPEAAPKLPFIGQKLFGIVLAGFTGLIMIYAYKQAHLPCSVGTAPNLGNTEMIARSLFTNYLLPFEVTSVLLLVAIVGAVVLAKSKLK
jgi:NADH-quinone oxidoreductase subunit J